MRKRDSQTSLSVAKLAEMQEKHRQEASVKCMMLYVHHAENHARFLSSHVMTVLFIAVNAFRNRDK
jgi:hypothetical protein